MGFKKAFKCQQYQGKDGKPCDCPAWTGIVETNLITGEVRNKEDCLYKMLPSLMVEVIKASNRPAAAVESCRNEIAQGLKRIADNMVALPAPVLEQKDALPSGEHSER